MRTCPKCNANIVKQYTGIQLAMVDLGPSYRWWCACGYRSNITQDHYPIRTPDEESLIEWKKDNRHFVDKFI